MNIIFMNIQCHRFSEVDHYLWGVECDVKQMDSSVGPVTKQVLLPEVIINSYIPQKLCVPIKCTLQAKICLIMKRFSVARSQAQKMFEAQSLSIS